MMKNNITVVKLKLKSFNIVYIIVIVYSDIKKYHHLYQTTNFKKILNLTNIYLILYKIKYIKQKRKFSKIGWKFVKLAGNLKIDVLDIIYLL